MRTVMSDKQRARSAETDVTSLERWEEEGGGGQFTPALAPLRSKLDFKERQILERLGAAVVSKWNDLPTATQRAIFEHAAYATYDLPGLRGANRAFPSQS